jgi:hypothetical protein
MKIYNKIIMNISTGKVVCEDSFEYFGPIAECGKGGGSGSSSTSIDTAYNAGMLSLSQEQQDWARAMFNQYQFGVGYWPDEPVRGAYISGEWVDEADITDAQKVLLRGTGGEIIDTTRGETRGYDPDAQTSEMEYQQNVIEANQGLLGQRTEAQSKFLSEALEGVDVKERMGLASADVAQGFAGAEGTARRSAARMGRNPANIDFGAMATNKAKAMGFARTGARIGAEDESFRRLQSAMGLGGI